MGSMVNIMFEKLFQNVDEHIIVLRPSKRIVYVNDRTSNSLQISHFASTYLKLDEASNKVWDEFLERLKLNYEGACTLMILWGDKKYRQVQLQAYYMPGKELIFAYLTLPIEQEFFNPNIEIPPLYELINGISQGIILTSANGKILSANDRALKTIGKQLSQVANHSHDYLFENLHNEPESVLQYYRHLAKGEVATIISEKKHESGAVSYVQIQSKMDTNLNVIITTIVNEEDREALNGTLKHQQVLNLVGELVASIAHEIRNPMTSIQGFLQLLKSNVQEENQHYFTIMESEFQRMELLIMDLLYLSSPKEIEFEQVCFLEMVNEVIDSMISQAILSNSIIEFQYDPKLSYIVNGNKARLKQMAINIIKNAIEAMEKGGTIKVHLDVSMDNRVQFKVTDEGHGMNEQTVNNLFNPFYTTKASGTGLGLVLVQKVVTEHKGQVIVQSKIGEGTTFTLTFQQLMKDDGLSLEQQKQIIIPIPTTSQNNFQSH